MLDGESNDRREGTWLVLGASGFVGCAARKELNIRGAKGVFARRQGTGAAPLEKETWRNVDAQDGSVVRALLREVRPAFVINAIGHSPSMPEAAMRDFYRLSTTTVLHAVRAEVPDARVVLLGSAAEYGNSPENGSREEDALQPLSAYACAKTEQFDIACRFAAGGTDVLTARLFNPLGPGQSERQFAGALMKRIRTRERPVRVQNANHLRDWIDIRDVARAVITLAENDRVPRVTNICTGEGRTVGEVAALAGELAGVEIEAIPGEISPKQLWRSIGNSDRLRALGWRPRHTLSESITDQWRCHR